MLVRTPNPGPEEMSSVDGTTVSVAVVSSRTEADLIVGLLGSHGVRARASADDAGGQEPQLQLDGVRVLVARADAHLAHRILNEDPGD